MTEAELAIVRRAYAKQMLAVFGVTDPRVEAAFAAVRREAYLGPGPWPIWYLFRRGYVATPSDDPVFLYQDVFVGLIPERNLNNGEPAGHAMLIACADARSGEHVVHIGAGVGYYTAILAHMVGDTGRVTAIEFDRGLAERLAANFAGQPNVGAVQGDGTKVDFEPADVIYASAGATRPVNLWLDRLKNGGRLILMLTLDKKFGAPAHSSASSDAATGFSPSGFSRATSSRVRAREMRNPSGRLPPRSTRAAGSG
jgi:protein-L-isoaspartate(D-aspartate) O-methyltransferase